MRINIRKISLVALALTAYMGCSGVRFDHTPSDTCQEFEDACKPNPKEGFNEYHYSFKVGSVGILIVVDNSGSMYTEQTKMADKFPHFINAISSLDWHMAITTTDIVADQGQLLIFPNGSDMISVNTPNKKDQFRRTIQRQETLECDNSGYKRGSCPSGDERGIYAINLAIDRGHETFFDKNHYAFIVLSDEDVRSNGGKFSGYSLKEYDLPETLVSKVKMQLGTQKTFSFHSIIIPSKKYDKQIGANGETFCYNQQNAQDQINPYNSNKKIDIQGFYGTWYEKLSDPSAELKDKGGIVDGHIGSICALDYGAQLGDIGSKIVTQSQTQKLPCNPQEPEHLQLTFSPDPGRHISRSVDEHNVLTVDPVPAGTIVNIVVKCSLTI